MVYGINVIAGPSEEPVSLAHAKLHLRNDLTDEDAKIADAITAARVHAEKYTGRFFIQQTVRLKLSGWPDDGVIRLTPFGANDVTSIAGFSYLDVSGVSQNVSNSTYQSEFSVNPPIIAPAPGETWPDVEVDRLYPITLDVVAGAANATVIDKRIGQAILLTLGYWDSDRGDAGLADRAESLGLPAGAKRLLNQVWTGGYGGE